MILAVFDDYNAFVEGLKALKLAGAEKYEAYSPVNISELEELMPKKGSWVQPWSGVGAIIGAIVFFLMCVLSSLLFGLYVGGKPPVSRLPFIVPAYEGTILVGGVLAFVAVMATMRLWPRTPTGPSFNQETFGISVECEPNRLADFVTMLRAAGAMRIDESN